MKLNIFKQVIIVICLCIISFISSCGNITDVEHTKGYIVYDLDEFNVIDDTTAASSFYELLCITRLSDGINFKHLVWTVAVKMDTKDTVNILSTHTSNVNVAGINRYRIELIKDIKVVMKKLEEQINTAINSVESTTEIQKENNLNIDSIMNVLKDKTFVYYNEDFSDLLDKNRPTYIATLIQEAPSPTRKPY